MKRGAPGMVVVALAGRALACAMAGCVAIRGEGGAAQETAAVVRTTRNASARSAKPSARYESWRVRDPRAMRSSARVEATKRRRGPRTALVRPRNEPRRRGLREA